MKEDYKKYIILILGFVALLFLFFGLKTDNRIKNTSKNLSKEKKTSKSFGKDNLLNFQPQDINGGVKSLPEQEQKRKVPKEETNNKNSIKLKNKIKNVQVKLPKHGEIWKKGEKNKIKWDSSNIERVDVKLIESPWICRGNSKCENFFFSQANSFTLARNLENKGEFIWPEDIENKFPLPSGKYVAEVSDSNEEVKSKSGDFAISSNKKKPIKVKFPTKGYEMDTSENQALTWVNPPEVFRVDIFLLEANCSTNNCSPGNKKQTILENKKGDGLIVLRKESLSGLPKGRHYIKMESSRGGYTSDPVLIKLK